MKDKLLKNINDNNRSIVNYLIDIIDTHNIKNLSELSKLEDTIFTFNSVCLNRKERINYLIKSLSNDYLDYDGLSFEGLQYLKKLKNNLNNSDENEVILNLIKILDFTNRDILLVNEAYCNIVQGLL